MDTPLVSALDKLGERDPVLAAVFRELVHEQDAKIKKLKKGIKKLRKQLIDITDDHKVVMLKMYQTMVETGGLDYLQYAFGYEDWQRRMDVTDKMDDVLRAARQAAKQQPIVVK